MLKRKTVAKAFAQLNKTSVKTDDNEKIYTNIQMIIYRSSNFYCRWLKPTEQIL
jgi:hypothetical protein